MFDFAGRRARLAEKLESSKIDLIFCPPSGDLEYLTGFPRRLATFGNYEHTHQWVTGAFIPIGSEPVFLVPEGYSAFNPPEGVAGEIIRVGYLDDSVDVFARTLRRFGPPKKIGVSARTWASTVLHMRMADVEVVDCDDLINQLRRIKEPAELVSMERAALIAEQVMAEVTPKVNQGTTLLELASEVDYQLRRLGSRTSSFDTGVWSMGPHDQSDATKRISSAPLRQGTGVCFDFGAVVDGYCSDFGRTIFLGDPDPEYVKCYDVVIAAQAAGIAAATPGNTAADVDEATRGVITAAGYGPWFRHRTGHGIGLDLHERPFISVEDKNVLEVGMTFTIEPSIFWPQHVGIRVEDVFVCEGSGCRSLNSYPRSLVAG